MNPKETERDSSMGGIEDIDPRTRERMDRMMNGEDTDDDEWSDADIFDSEIAPQARTAPATDIFEAQTTDPIQDTSDLWETAEDQPHEADNTHGNTANYTCKHGKIKYDCKDCGSSRFCTHGRRKADCREC